MQYGPTGRSLGSATVIFHKPDHAAKAVKALDGIRIDNRLIKVEVLVSAANAPAAAAPTSLAERVSYVPEALLATTAILIRCPANRRRISQSRPPQQRLLQRVLKAAVKMHAAAGVVVAGVPGRRRRRWKSLTLRWRTTSLPAMQPTTPWSRTAMLDKLLEATQPWTTRCCKLARTAILATIPRIRWRPCSHYMSSAAVQTAGKVMEHEGAVDFYSFFHPRHTRFSNPSRLSETSLRFAGKITN